MSSTFSSSSLTRGFWFTAPTAFTITGLRVPTDVGTLVQNVAVVRLNAAPPSWPTTTNSFTTLLRQTGVSGTGWISTSIPVSAGQIIGVLGARGTSTMYNSYSGVTSHASAIKGQAITLRRFGMQYNLYSNVVQNVWTEVASVSRVEMQYQ